MKEDFRTPTVLEQAILTWFTEKFVGTSIGRQIESAKIVNREWTRVGFFLELVVDSAVLSFVTVPSSIFGPSILSPGIEHGGGAVLFLKDRRVSVLELYSNGDRFDENTFEFELGELAI